MLQMGVVEVAQVWSGSLANNAQCVWVEQIGACIAVSVVPRPLQSQRGPAWYRAGTLWDSPVLWHALC